MGTREDLAMMIEWEKVSQAYIDAKAARNGLKVGDDGYDEWYKDYSKKKAKMSEMRTYWRQIRDAVAEGVDAEGNKVSGEFVDVEG